MSNELLLALPDAVVAADEDGRVVFVNSAAETLFGAPARSLIGGALDRLVPRLGRPGEITRLRVKRKDGVEIEVEAAQAILDGRLILSMRHHAEVAFDSDESYRAVFDNAPIGILHFDARGVITACNDRFVAILGSSRRLLVGLAMATLPDARIIACVSEVLAGRASRFEGDYRAATSGKLTPVHADFTPIRGAGGEVMGGVGIVEDITEQKAAASALRRSEGAFRTLIESMPEAIGVHREGRFIYVNPAWVRMLGHASAHEMLGHAVTEVLHPDERAGFADRMRQLLQTHEMGTREARLLRRDGSAFTAEIEALAIHFDGAEAIIVIARDVTERRQLQARLALADRMASVGTLAAGVAHEINNPLAYVTASLDLALRKLQALRAVRGKASLEATATQLETSLSNAREGAERVSTIVHDLRMFSRADENRRVLVDVERVLDSTVNMAWNQIRKRARLVKQYGGVSAVWGDEARLGQVFLNLLVNAAQAIPEGDSKANEISVTTRDLDEGRVAVEVRDTGSGIPAEIASRIFEPFVTTKPVGVGTGLGLSICHGIVTALGGEISVESAPGKGSLFRVLLQARGRGRETPAAGMAVISSPGRRRILIVDDEIFLGRALRNQLSGKHDVVLASSGSEAVELLLHDDRFDLVLCDLSMPDMTGLAVYEEIQRVRPGVHERFVFMSGAASRNTAAKLDKLPNPRLDKPFEPAQVEALFRKRARKA